MVIDKSLAKGLATRSMEQAVAYCKANTDRIFDLYHEGMRDQNNGRPTSKVVRNLLKNLRVLFAKPGIFGYIHDFDDSRRKHGVMWIGPDMDGDQILFSLTWITLDERKPLEPPPSYPQVVVTRHAFERLHQRMNTLSPDEVMVEIFSAVLPALKLRAAAKQVGARQWPLPSHRGLFVAIPAAKPPLTALLTWLPRENLAHRWSSVMSDLEKIPDLMGIPMLGAEAVAECLDRHPWLKEEYTGRDDPESAYWNSRPVA